MATSLNFPDIRDALARISRGERATTQSLNVPSLLQFWLWGSDANELCDRGKCDFHLMHLSGMVCTRVFSEAYHTVADRIQVVPSIIDDEDVIELTDRCDIFLPHFYGDNSNQPTSTLVAARNLSSGEISRYPLELDSWPSRYLQFTSGIHCICANCANVSITTSGTYACTRPGRSPKLGNNIFPPRSSVQPWFTELVRLVWFKKTEAY
jgi:hypothetical protein